MICGRESWRFPVRRAGLVLVVHLSSMVQLQTLVAQTAQFPGIVERHSTKSRIDFAIYNDGSIFASNRTYSDVRSVWPRGTLIGQLDDWPGGLWFG